MELLSKTFQELSAGEVYEILKSRSEIFFMQQNIHCQDMDDVDYDSLHCFFMENNRVTAYLRAYYEGDGTVKIGRVLTLDHGTGLGRELMLQSLAAINEKMKCGRITVDAQKHAEGFYKKFGFRTVSDDFLEEGIIHVAMELIPGCS